MERSEHLARPTEDFIPDASIVVIPTMYDLEYPVSAKELTAEKRKQCKNRTIRVDYIRPKVVDALRKRDWVLRGIPSTPANRPTQFLKVVSNRIDRVWRRREVLGTALALKPGASRA